MAPLMPWMRARGRAARKALLRAVVILFIVMVAVLPLPFVPFVAFLIKPMRRNEPAEVYRKEEDDDGPIGGA